VSQLVAYRSTVVTPDTAEALRLLEVEGARRGGLKIRFRGVKSTEANWDSTEEEPGPSGLPAPLSMRPTGREVYLSVILNDRPDDRMSALSVLWAMAIPLGFVPWDRYPLPGPTDTLFHFLGPWATLADFLQGEGCGELVWPSLCAAAQCDVGKWEGTRKVERSIQTHLHRLGIPCGPVDGEISERTLASLRALGLGGGPVETLLPLLEKMQPPRGETAQSKGDTGFFTMKGQNKHVEPFCAGLVRASRTNTGISVTVDGPGRLILLFGGHSQ